MPFKQNTHGSIHNQKSRGGILRDFNGKMIMNFALPLNTSNVIFSELYAIYYGLQMCERFSYYVLWIESDALSAINLILSNNCFNADLFTLLKI